MTETDDLGNVRKRGLGRGLAALLGSAEGDEVLGAREPRSLPIELLQPSSLQPRRHFDEEQLEALTDSVRRQGIMQPLVVRPGRATDGQYEIVAGERRWRAAQRAGLHDVPVVIRALSDAETLEIALIENLQREDLSAIEEAHAYQRLIAEFGHTQEALGQVVGRSRSHVANTLRLLALPEDVRALVQEGRLSAGHARALVTADEPSAIAREVVRQDLSVRQTEALARERAPAAVGAIGEREKRDPNLQALERELSELLGLPVSLKGSRSGAGRMTIAYRSADQLEGLISRLS